MADGFSSYEAGAYLWKVTHNHGTTFVRAMSEAIALQRFLAKYPNYQVREIKRSQSFLVKAGVLLLCQKHF